MSFQERLKSNVCVVIYQRYMSSGENLEAMRINSQLLSWQLRVLQESQILHMITGITNITQSFVWVA